jgi:hypothetical protein
MLSGKTRHCDRCFSGTMLAVAVSPIRLGLGLGGPVTLLEKF